MTRPDVLISGGPEDEPRQLHPGLRRAFIGVVGLLVLAYFGNKLVDAQQRRAEALRVADRVEVEVRISDAGNGAEGSVFVGVQVSGRGAELRVEAPVLVPPEIARTTVSGAPIVVSAGRGNLIAVRLHPDCERAIDPHAVVSFDVPVTPASGKRHLIPVAFDAGPELLRRACGFVMPDEALTTLPYGARIVGDRLELHVELRNDGRDALAVAAVESLGLDVAASTLPLQVAGRRTGDLGLVLRVADCSAVPTVPPTGFREGALILMLEAPNVASTRVDVALDGTIGVSYDAWLSQRCG